MKTMHYAILLMLAAAVAWHWTIAVVLIFVCQLVVSWHIRSIEALKDVAATMSVYGIFVCVAALLNEGISVSGPLALIAGTALYLLWSRALLKEPLRGRYAELFGYTFRRPRHRGDSVHGLVVPTAGPLPKHLEIVRISRSEHAPGRSGRWVCEVVLAPVPWHTIRELRILGSSLFTAATMVAIHYIGG